MGLSEGAGGAIVKYGILAGIIIGGGILIWKWFQENNPFGQASDTINNITHNITYNVTGQEAADKIQETWEKENVTSSLDKGGDLAYDTAAAWQGIDTTGEYNKPWYSVITDLFVSASTLELTSRGTITQIPLPSPIVPESEVWKVPQDAAVLGGYLYQVGWVSEDANQHAYPLWKDKYSNELMVGWDVNYIRSLENLLLSDIRLGEEGRHNWSLM
jgi:hypothetical protein